VNCIVCIFLLYDGLNLLSDGQREVPMLVF
jgi:hypothetical protein